MLSLPASTLLLALHSHATCVSYLEDTPLGVILHLSLGLWARVGLWRGSLHICFANSKTTLPLCARGEGGLSSLRGKTVW